MVDFTVLPILWQLQQQKYQKNFLTVIVRRCCNNYEICLRIGLLCVQCDGKLELPDSCIILYVFIALQRNYKFVYILQVIIKFFVPSKQITTADLCQSGEPQSDIMSMSLFFRVVRHIQRCIIICLTK